jgi:hypothetical protein
MLARLTVLVAAVGAGAFGILRGTWAVGGSDSSCYALMADAFAGGELQPTSLLAIEAPWPDPSRTLAPGGFIPSPRRADAASPICSPGFALLLAPLRAVGGRDAIFLLTPAAGAVLVWLTFMLGRQISGDIAGAAAAVIVATMPVLLFQIVQPMNDVAAAAVWMAITVLAARPEPNYAAIGAATGLAMIIRPNLAGAALPVFAWVVWTGPQAGHRMSTRWRAAARFLLWMAPGLIITAGFNHVLYGHVVASGYGNTSNLFSPAHIPSNVRNYGSALLETQLGFPLVAVAAPFTLPKSRPVVWLIVAIAAAVACTYLLYIPYPEWWYLRFFLPVLPMLTVLATSAVVTGIRRTAVVGVLVVLMAVFALSSNATRQALTLQRLESRFRATADVVGRLPANAVFLTVWESGTVRYHAGRDAVLWDSLDPAWLDRSIEWLTSRGHEPFVILEQWEEPTFRQRFSSHSTVGNVDWPPRFDIDRQVRVFSPKDRSRYFAGESIPTEIVRTDRR